MRKRNLALIATLAALFAFAPPPAHAQTAEEALADVNQWYDEDHPAPADLAQLSGDVEAWRKSTDGNTASDLITAVGFLAELRQRTLVLQMSSDAGESSETARMVLATELKRWIDELQAGKAAVDIGVARWKYDVNQSVLGNNTISYFIDVGALLNDECGAGRCEEAKSFAMHIISVSTIAWHVANHLKKEAMHDFAARAQQVSDRWDAYFAESKSQNPLELWVNASEFSRKHKYTRGFINPPTHQWLMLHLTPGYEFVIDDGIDTMTPSLLVEVIGFYRWSWKAASAERSGRFGLSVVTAYAAAPNSDKLGVGGLLHVFNSSFSAGVVWRDTGDGDVSVVLSADLWKAFSDKDKLVGRFRGLIQ